MAIQSSTSTAVTVPGTISPKVYVPVLSLLVIGIVLILLGVVVDEQELKTLGYGVLGAAVPAAIAGFTANPGQTMERYDPARAPILDEASGPDPIEPIDGESGFVTYDLLAILLAVIGVVLIVWGHLIFGVIALVIGLVAFMGTRGFTTPRR